jgi:murein DD-endopeptidase MepM/ murein hydrolase activator NlpD
MLHADRLPQGIGTAMARVMGRGLGPVLAVVLGVSLLVGAAQVGRTAYGKPHLSGYVPGRDGSAPIVVRASARVAGAAAPAPAAAPSVASAGLQVVANGNYSAVPAGIDPATPYGPPVARTDWVISKDYAAHGGHSNTGAVDFAFAHDYQALGAPIVATHAGRVKLLTDDPTYGNLVYVMGPHYTTTYGHMQKFDVHDGDQVVRGTVLGEMGSTGNSTGPHVDYQVWRDGDNQDPMDYGIAGAQGAGPMH